MKQFMSFFMLSALASNALAFCPSKVAEAKIASEIKRQADKQGTTITNVHYIQFMSPDESKFEYNLVADKVDAKGRSSKQFMHFEIDAEDETCPITHMMGDSMRVLGE